MTGAALAAAPRRTNWRGRRTEAGVLTPEQSRWLGALLVAAQFPHVSVVPNWVALFGIVLVGVRFALLRRDMKRLGLPPTLVPTWSLVLLAVAAGAAIRLSFGYFLGRDPCVSFLFILVGIKFLEARTTRDGTVILCLASFLFVTPFFYSQSPFAALAAAPAVLLFGATLEVLCRPAGDANAKIPWQEPLRRSGRLLLHGIPLAAVLFILFPRLAVPLWGVPTDRAGTTGLSDKMAPGQISELSLSDAVAFRVDFDDVVPPPRQRYWRWPVLSRFDGREWAIQPQRLDGVILPVARGPISYTVTLEAHFKPWLFALDLPASLPRIAVDADSEAQPTTEFAGITRSQQLIARNIVLQTIRYRQLSAISDHFRADPGRDAEENLRLPSNRANGNPKALAFAHELRAEHPDDADFIRAVLLWFRNEPFVYTLSPLYIERDPIDGFLFDTRRGFCEHYASAFVFLLRAAGIPARVVTGYQGGEMNPRGGYMIVRQSDAHAWAEAIVDGEWRRYDPTGAVSPSRIELGLGGAMPSEERVPLLARIEVSWIKSAQLMWDAVNYDWRRRVIGFDFQSQRTLWRDWKFDRLAAWQYMGVVGAMALVWVGLLLGWLGWRRRQYDRARMIWNALCARLGRAGLPRQPHEGPLAYAGRAAARWPQFAAALIAIGESYAVLRYGPTSTQRDNAAERAAMLAQLKRAVDLLPAARALRLLHGARGAAA